MTEDEVLALFERCSNQGRWGPDDELGTLNFVTSEVRRAALAGVVHGEVVSIGKDLRTRGSAQVPPSAVHAMVYGGHSQISAQDLLTLVPHGFEMTHLDALAHSYFDGRIYNGRVASDVVTPSGITFGSIAAFAEGILTRGVLLDVPAARGVEHLEAGEGIGVADLEAAEHLAGTEVREGDAVLVRSGIDRRLGDAPADPSAPREGLLPQVVPWLHERRVSLYSGDCIERLPSGYERVPLPLHQVGMVAMGLVIADCVDAEALAATCRRFGRHDFLLVIAPLRVPGGSASPVNPLAVF